VPLSTRLSHFEIERHLRVRINVNYLRREGELPLMLVHELGLITGLRDRFKIEPLPGTCDWPQGVGLPW